MGLLMTESLSEETRNMLTAQTRAMMALIDEISKVPTNPHASLIRRLQTMKNQLSLNEPMPVYDVTTLDMAIKALQAHS